MTPPSQPGMYRERLGRRRLVGRLFALVSLAATLFGVVMLVVMLGAVVAKALELPPEAPWYRIDLHLAELWSFLTHLATRYSSTSPDRAGYKAGIVGTLWLMGLVAVTAIPVGVGAAVYLEEIARPGGVRQIIQTNLANLAGVPSIVYGILGLVVFSRAFGFKPVDQRSLLIDGALTLSLLILPVVVIATQEALRAVPPSLRQGALALGRDPLAGDPRPRPAVGLAGNPDRNHPRPLSRRGRNRAAPARGGRVFLVLPPEWAVRPILRPAGADLRLCQAAGHRVPFNLRWRHPDPARDSSYDERRGDLVPQPLRPPLIHASNETTCVIPRPR